MSGFITNLAYMSNREKAFISGSTAVVTGISVLALAVHVFTA